MTIREREFTSLYQWAQRYAKACSSSTSVLDEQDALQEMALVALDCPHKSAEYVKQAMRNRAKDLARHESMIRRYILPIDGEHENVRDADRIERIADQELARRLLAGAQGRYVIVLNRLMQGHTIADIERMERVTRRTIHRYILKARGTLLTWMN